ncbi:MAG: hypothetical protein ACJ764_01280, partial [Solirubrobacteraceae bacterium]
MRALTSTPGLRAHRRGRRALSAALSFVAAWVAPQTVVWLVVPPAASADETVMVCDIYGNHVAPQPRDTHGIHTTSRCPGNPARAHYSPARPPGGMAIWTLRHQTVKRGRGVHWTLTAPPGLRIASVDIPHMYSHGLDDGGGWGGALYWSGGSGSVRTFDGESSWSSANSGGARFEWPSRGTRYFGWRVRCRARRCTKGGDRWLTMELLELHVHETTRPHLIAPDGLWRAEGWIRGTWTLHLLGDSPSGLCATGSAINGEPGPGSIVKHNPAVWHQCDAPPVDQAVDTAQYGQGALPLTITTIDGAGASVSRTRTIHVDNQRPTVSLSGPRDASSSEGTQYVHATATAGPSGVKGIVCSLDHAPALWYPSPRAAVAVRGVGIHHLFCFSVNRARDAAGLPRTSVRADWTLSIRAPSVSTVSFVKVKGALRCHRQRERVRIPAHWVTAYHHGHPVRIRLRAQTRRIRVVRCHLRVVHRRVWRHGHWVRRRIVLLPHRVSVRHLHVHFGRGATISGW